MVTGASALCEGSPAPWPPALPAPGSHGPLAWPEAERGPEQLEKQEQYSTVFSPVGLRRLRGRCLGQLSGGWPPPASMDSPEDVPSVCFECEGTYCSFPSTLSLFTDIRGDPFTSHLVHTHTGTRVRLIHSSMNTHGLPCPAALATPARAEAGASLGHSPGILSRTERLRSMTTVPQHRQGRCEGKNLRPGAAVPGGEMWRPRQRTGPRDGL